VRSSRSWLMGQAYTEYQLNPTRKAEPPSDRAETGGFHDFTRERF